MYNELLERKKKGEKINIKDLLEDDLRKLFIEEGCIKRDIANLCDCTMGQVDYRLKKYGINFWEKVIKRTIGAINF